MQAERARQFVGQNHRGVLATLRKDGRPQVTPVMAGVDEGGRVEISSSELTAKVRNLRRDPRASLCMLTESFFGESTQILGIAEIVSLPEAMDGLVEYYRRIAGEHPDWGEYREAMKREQRCLIKITIEQAIP